jgi:CheY-like chemotaxis protein
MTEGGKNTFTGGGGPAPDPDGTVRRHIESGVKLAILVAEDELINQKYLESAIERLGLSCDVASDGAETLALMRKTRYDIVFLDMQMPVMSGEEVLEAAGREGLRGDTTFIALTAYTANGDRERYLSLGCSSFISKPIHIRMLKELISDAIARKNGMA